MSVSVGAYADTAIPLTVPGVGVGRTQGLAEAGASLVLNIGASLHVAYQGAFGGGTHANAITAGAAVAL
jgi:uncharacterized protein with beta-barrel porin domain